MVQILVQECRGTSFASRKKQIAMRSLSKPIEDDALPMKQRRRGPAFSKAELRIQAEQAVAATNKPILKLPTKVVRQCGRCGESSTVMVEPGQPLPTFKCQWCDRP